MICSFKMYFWLSTITLQESLKRRWCGERCTPHPCSRHRGRGHSGARWSRHPRRLGSGCTRSGCAPRSGGSASGSASRFSTLTASPSVTSTVPSEQCLVVMSLHSVLNVIFWLLKTTSSHFFSTFGTQTLWVRTLSTVVQLGLGCDV